MNTAAVPGADLPRVFSLQRAASRRDDLPFGGIGGSGMGSYPGREGFQRFSHAKAIFKQSRMIDIGRMLRPPFGPKIERLLKMQIKK